MAKQRKRRPVTQDVRMRRACDLIDFLQDVVFGKRQATEAEVERACRELDQYLPSLEPDRVTLQ
jgi:hypothetical protein